MCCSASLGVLILAVLLPVLLPEEQQPLALDSAIVPDRLRLESRLLGG